MVESINVSQLSVFERIAELEARYALFAQWAEGRRVLDMSGASCRTLMMLAEAGADEMTAIVNDPAAVEAELSALGVEGVEVVKPEGPPTAFAEASFDLIVCHDLPELLKATPAWQDELRRILAVDGYLVVSLANPKGRFLSELAGQRFQAQSSYEDLYKLLKPTFGKAAIFGQSPVVASLFFDFEADEEEMGMSFDRALLTDEGEEPGWYVLVFAQEPPHLTDLSIVQLPYDQVLKSLRSLPPAQAKEEGERAAGRADETVREAAPALAELEAARRQNADLNAEVQKLRSLSDQLQKERTEYQARQAEAKAAESKAEAKAAELIAEAKAAELKAEASANERVRDAQETAQTLLRQAQADFEGKLKEMEAATQTRVLDLEQHAKVLAEALAQADEKAKATQAAPAAASQEELEKERTIARAANERAAALEVEATRFQKDRVSLETQIRDLLDEVGQLREQKERSAGEISRLASELGAREQAVHVASAELQTLRQSATNADNEVNRLREELARLKMKIINTESEREAMAAELNSLRSGLEKQESAALRSSEPSEPVASGGQVTHDAVGRQIETTLEDIEDLLATTGPRR
jgi:archaellum component FlaC